MAYAAVNSLRMTIERIVYSGHMYVNENSSRRIIELVYEEVHSLIAILGKLNKSSSLRKSSSRSRSINRQRINALDVQIREAISEFEDILDFHVVDQIHPQCPTGGEDDIIHPLLFTLDFEQLHQQYVSFKETVIKLKAEYIHQLGEVEEEEEEEEDDDVEAEQVLMNVVPSSITHNDNDDDEESDMVGLSDKFNRLKDQITRGDKLQPGSEWNIISLSGMAGIGKTALAKKLFRDPEIASPFQRRAFVTIGQKYQLEAVLLDILSKVNPDHVELSDQVKQKSSAAAFLKRMVSQSLENRRCFIVLDDVWHITIWNELKSVFPTNDCQVLLTSRLIKVARLAPPGASFDIPFLNKKESWHLLCNKVFGGDEGESLCPPQLVRAGKKIAEYCDGLPLTILKVADILSRADITLEYWNEVVAGQKQHQVFVDAYEQMFEVLYLSYDYLPQYLKSFFLYIGVFPQNYEIPCYKLINLWCGEGLYAGYSSLLLLCLSKLRRKNLVMIIEESYNNITKIISLHSTFWYMCNKVARENKFFYCLNTCADALAEDHMKSQRRLCIQNNVLFAIKDAHDSISSTSTVRSLLCTGTTYHQYPVPICWNLKLLRVLDALMIRFYEFPMEALNQANLAYLALTLDEKLPSSVSRLWNLRFLIVHQHVRIVKSPSYLPMEIWNMKQLEHLQVMGSDLPNPCEGSHDARILPCLQVLSGVSAESCTEDIFKRIPHLHKLRVRIELGPDDDEPLCFFNEISQLHVLKTLKCIMATPKITSGVVAPPAPLSIFSSSLKKLTLSGMGYPWEEMQDLLIAKSYHAEIAMLCLSRSEMGSC